MTKKNRIIKERQTVERMVRIYCRDHHNTREMICAECCELMTFAHKRLELCKFGEKKPTCGKCPVHCYKPEMRAKIVNVMRYAGPRMLFEHPINALQHLFDSLRKAP